MKIDIERLKNMRVDLGLNKAEAARLINISAMAYGRYENGEREPSFQTVSYIAQTFGTTTDYLYGITDEQEADSILISGDTDKELFDMITAIKSDENTAKRILAYYQKITGQK